MISFFKAKKIIATSMIFVATCLYAVDDEKKVNIKKKQKKRSLIYGLVSADRKIDDENKKAIKSDLKNLINNFDTEDEEKKFFSAFKSYEKASCKGSKTFTGFISYLLGSRTKECFSWTTNLIKLLPASYLKRHLLEMVRKTLDNGNLDYFKTIVEEHPEICDKDILTILYKESTFFREPKNKSGYNRCKVWLREYLKLKFNIEFADEKFNREDKSVARIMASDLPQMFAGQHERKDVENLLSFFQSVAKPNDS